MLFEFTMFTFKRTSYRHLVGNTKLIGPVGLARKNEAGGSWGQEVHILHVNV